LSSILRARETNGNRVNTGILAEEQQKKKRRKPTRQRRKGNLEQQLDYTRKHHFFSLHLSIYSEKKKKKIREME
jgi:hypothetical protein